MRTMDERSCVLRSAAVAGLALKFVQEFGGEIASREEVILSPGH